MEHSQEHALNSTLYVTRAPATHPECAICKYCKIIPELPDVADARLGGGSIILAHGLAVR